MHPSILHFGSLRIPFSGLCAALGLVAAHGLTQRTARMSRLNPAAAGDAVLVLVCAAFFISRALLVAANWRGFLAYPWLVLSLPSLNDTGVLLTAFVMAAYLRRRGLHLLGFLDAITPCAALVWAFLGLGGVLDGTRDGMPRGRGAQPVEWYTVVAAILLCGVLLRVLTHRPPAGHSFALGVALAGVAVFLLDFLRVPSELFAAAMLDPVQWLGLAMLVVGCSLYLALPEVPAPARMGSTDAV